MDTSALLFVKLKEVKQEHVLVTKDENGNIKEDKHVHHHYVGPSVPGMRVSVIASNPKKPNVEQLWLVDTTKPVIVALSEEPNIEWLGVSKAQKMLDKWGVPIQVDEVCIGHNPAVIEPN